MRKSKNKNARLADRRGFTLVELLLSVFIFSLLMTAAVAIFARFVTFQKRSRGVQQNMENARYAMELMAKSLRTSSVISCNGADPCPMSPLPTSVELYDYSQGKCIRYYLQNNKIKTGSKSADRADCNFGIIPAGVDMTSNYINRLVFRAIKTDNASSQVGRVTISVQACSNASCIGAENDQANLETTVSLRDYVETTP